MKKVLRCDTHVHTGYSFDNDTPMANYPQRAIELDVDVVCFTDHIDCTPHFNVFDDFQFGKRAEEFHTLKAKYGKQVKLLLGFEVGEPHLHQKETDFLNSLAPDMIIGSIHRPADYEQPRHYTNHEYERLYDKYVHDMVDWGQFDVLGHMDMPKRYHDDYVEDTETLHSTLALCLARNVIPELNTSQLRYGGDYTLPSIENIAYYQKLGGKFVCIGSDCHDESILCANFDKVVQQLPKGLSVCYFENRKLVSLNESDK